MDFTRVRTSECINAITFYCWQNYNKIQLNIALTRPRLPDSFHKITWKYMMLLINYYYHFYHRTVIGFQKL